MTHPLPHVHPILSWALIVLAFILLSIACIIMGRETEHSDRTVRVLTWATFGVLFVLCCL